MRRNAFVLQELVIAFVILGLVLTAAIQMLRESKENVHRAKEYDTYYTIESGIKTSFENVIDAFAPVCANISNDAQASWGWGHAQCNKTSPLPIYVATSKIRYQLNLNQLTAANRSMLVNEIVDAFSPYCTLDAQTNTTLDLFCPYVRNLQYDIAGGVNASAHTLGSDIDPRTAPSVVLTYRRVSTLGNIAPQDMTYRASLSDLWSKRNNFTLEKWNDIRTMLKQLYENRMTLELANSPTNGLNSTFDAFVPWFWEAFGNAANPSAYPVCALGGSTKCLNLNSSNHWRTAAPAPALIMRRLMTNLMSADPKYAVDGFGNMVRLYPIMSKCGVNDISTCLATAPALPQRDYYNLESPPWTSSLYLATCRNKKVAAPDYCRMLIAY